MLRTTKTLFDSLGVSLPDRRVTTAEILGGCHNPIRLPLERLTGIHARRLAGDGLYSIDLAEGALRQCLERSPVAAADYGLLICTNISRRDGANTFSYEPAAALVLKKRLGLDAAMALDLSNACAGMWTGVYLADALIRTGEVRHALVVSGEYISYLIETAQREITGFMDPQIASLTLGDAGVAVSLGLSPSPDVGLHDLDLYTLSKYSPHCIAKPTDQEHGGAVMYTDAIKVTEAVVPHAARHAKLVVDRNGWPLERIDHVVPHQTSQLTMQEAKKEIQRLYQYDFGDCFLNNLAERGNTSSNSHFLALADAIAAGTIRPGQNLAFCISGSGQTTGTALYTMDELPDRLTSATAAGLNGASSADGQAAPQSLPAMMQLESIAVCDPTPGEPADTLSLLTKAATDCLDGSAFGKDEVDLLLSVGTYRSEFVMEPAIAALVGGRLQMNDDQPADATDKTLAFDILSGPVGFLKAVYLAGELARAGQIEQAMVLACEVENNRAVPGEPLLGVREVATACLLRESADGESGFLATGFEDFLDRMDDQTIAGGWNAAGKAYVQCERSEDYKQRWVDCVVTAAGRFLDAQGLTRDQVSLLLPPQVCGPVVDAVADRLGFSREQTVCVADGEDFATSSVPASVHAARRQGLARPGDLGLVLAVGAGVQVGCALYRF